ncbi:MAG: VCBS repeat-containing protein [Phycisphaerae bacterium]|nr:VCBS repeat-containing protein [Phycisphaerae bacterium]
MTDEAMINVRAIACSIVLACTFASPTLCAEDKNGVSPQTISRPKGPGSLEGLGDSFQPALNNGTARYTVQFALPEGIAGFTPELSVRYDSGRGFGPVGIGWSLGPGCIRRQTEKGLPRYGEAPDGEEIADRFLGMDGEELVRLQNEYYLAKVEGLYLRYRHIEDGPDDHWEAHTKSGTKLEFGVTPEARVTDIDTNGAKIYCWHLEQQIDTHGNVIKYEYEKLVPTDGQVYLTGIRYGPGSDPNHYYSAELVYEDRLDPFVDCRPGFRVCSSKRLWKVHVTYDGALIRHYELGYGAHPHWSLLTTITQYGADGTSTLPDTTFTYSVFDPGDPAVPISAAGHVVSSSGPTGAVMDNPNVDLIDLNADGLPDLLSTETSHVAYVNRGQRDIGGGQQAILWEGPIQVDAAEGRTYSFQLASDNVHLADMTGDGISDLVIKDLSDNVEFFANTGQLGWAAGQLMSVETNPPPAPSGEAGESVEISDLGFNKRIDVIQSQYGANFTWFNQGDGRYTGPVVTEGVFYGQQFIDFADAGVQLADMNGDRLNDVVKVTTTSVIYWASKGYARFDDAVEMILQDRALDDSPGGNLHRAKLTDVNGDGLSDLVVEQAQGSDLWFWLNLGDGTFELSRVVVDLPVTSGAVVRWADINGNGTTDVIYADSSLPGSKLNAVDLGELIGGSPYYNLLTSIDNGFGRQTTIHYRSTTDFYVDAHEAGHPWTTSVPFPTQVVSRVETGIGLDLDGYPDEGTNGDSYKTDIVYRDGYYDPIEHQFRGFAFVRHIQHGDERFGDTIIAPTLVTRHGFHTGAPDGIDNDGDGETDEPGDLWIGREEEPLKGVELWRETTVLEDVSTDGLFAPDSVVFERVQAAWVVRDLCDADTGGLPHMLGNGYRTNDDYNRQVRQAVRTEETQSIIERGQGTTRQLKTEYDIDALGNALFEWNHGDLSNPDDDLYTGYEYALDGQAEAAWIINRVSRTFQADGGPDGEFVSETRNYYDAAAFAGLPIGQVGDYGDLHRTEVLISDGSVPPLTERSFAIGDPGDPEGCVDVLRQKFDVYGNSIVLRDANDYDRVIEYDSVLHKFPVRETIVIGGGSADLTVEAAYDYAFGVPRTITDFNGQTSRFEYDTFGRFHQEFWPGDEDVPTHTYTYDIDTPPVHSITTVAHTNLGGSPDVSATVFFDGLGRKLGIYEPGDGDVEPAAMSEVTLYNQRGQPWKVYQPYQGGDGDWSAPPDTYAANTLTYDATGRVIEIVTPPDDYGATATIRREYLPLQVKEFDGEDNRDGPHFDTPKTLLSDGLGRLIEVHEIETLSAVESEDTFVTRYRYALPDLLAEIEDAKGNVKYMRYDGLGRKIFMNDLDRGHMYYTYDDAGNLLSTVDAKGQQIDYTYDGANRLLAVDYLDSRHPLSLGRTPDIAYHYDEPPVPADDPPADYPDPSYTKGQLAWVEDLTGAEFHGYDVNGQLETVIKRIGGTTEDYTTITRTDSLGRVYEIQYPGPDGLIVTNEYDARGLLRAIPGFVDPITYVASGQKQSMAFANDVDTTYSYDPRSRLRTLFTESRFEVLQDLTYEFDQADNIVGIADARDLSVGDPRSQTASFVMDNLYRLRQATGVGYGPGGGGGTIQYDYDRLGNMALKTSPDIPDPDVHIGEMLSGGPAGTAGRIGRNPGDPPGPHALTATTNGFYARTFDYDTNGNMTAMNVGHPAPFADCMTGPGGTIPSNGCALFDFDNDLDMDLQDFAQFQVHVGAAADDAMEMHYDFADRLGRIIKAGPNPPDIRYLYDYTGRRVIKRVDGLQTTYINRLSEIRNGEFLKYVFANGTRIARIETSKKSQQVKTSKSENWADSLQRPDISTFRRFDVSTFFYHPDHLGSTNVVTGTSGHLVSESYNYPFGSLRHDYDAGDGFDPHYRFTGKEEDEESELVYFEARFYAPHLGRFITTDPLHGGPRSLSTLAGEYEATPEFFARLAAPKGFNLYVYVDNNPLVYVDPLGMEKKPVKEEVPLKEKLLKPLLEAGIKKEVATTMAEITATYLTTPFVGAARGIAALLSESQKEKVKQGLAVLGKETPIAELAKKLSPKEIKTLKNLLKKRKELAIEGKKLAANILKATKKISEKKGLSLPWEQAAKHTEKETSEVLKEVAEQTATLKQVEEYREQHKLE